MASRRIMLCVATGVTTVSGGVAFLLHKKREEKINNRVYEYTHFKHRIEVSSKEVDKVAPMFDSICEEYVDNGETDACIGGGTALKLYTKKDFTPFDVDIFTTTSDVSKKEEKEEKLKKVLGDKNMAFVPEPNSYGENLTSDVVDLMYCVGKYPLKKFFRTQIVHVSHPATTVAKWYLSKSDVNICITKFDGYYVFMFSSKAKADMIKDGYLRLPEKTRAKKYEKYGFITDTKSCDEHYDKLVENYRSQLKVPFFSW